MLSGAMFPILRVVLLVMVAGLTALGANPHRPGVEPGVSSPETPATGTQALETGDWISVPGGEVQLGSDDREKGFGYVYGGEAAWRWKWFHQERRRTVNLAPFDIGATPVTQAAYAQFVRGTGHRAPFISMEAYRAQGFLVHPYASVRSYLWREGAPPMGRAQHPVVLVDAQDAGAFCRWRGRREARQCSLPSEDQWELAARGRDGRYYPWGNTWEPERVNTQERGPYGTTPVRAHPEGRSPFGLHDMAGNVFEWTATRGPKGGGILKGCSWDDLGGICRAAARHERPLASRHILIGFRCACAPQREDAR